VEDVPPPPVVRLPEKAVLEAQEESARVSSLSPSATILADQQAELPADLRPLIYEEPKEKLRKQPHEFRDKEPRKPSNSDTDRFSREEAARRLKIAIRTLDYRVEAGLLHPFRDGRRVFFLSEELDAYERCDHPEPACPSARKTRDVKKQTK
jgi:hypothetical protein